MNRVIGCAMLVLVLALALVGTSACTSAYAPDEIASAGAGGAPHEDAGEEDPNTSEHGSDAGGHENLADAVVPDDDDAGQGDASVLDGGDSGPSDASDASDDDASVGEAGEDAVVDRMKLAALCEASPAERVGFDDDEGLIELLVGKWIDCRDSTGFHPDQDGVWFREDGTWAALFLDDTNHVRTGAGIDETGEWHIYREPDPGPQPPLLSVGSGFIVRPVFTRDPIQLRDADENVYLERYVRLRDVL